MTRSGPKLWQSWNVAHPIDWRFDGSVILCKFWQPSNAWSPISMIVSDSMIDIKYSQPKKAPCGSVVLVVSSCTYCSLLQQLPVVLHNIYSNSFVTVLVLVVIVVIV